MIAEAISRRRGLATEALRLMMAYAMLHLVPLFALNAYIALSLLQHIN